MTVVIHTHPNSPNQLVPKFQVSGKKVRTAVPLAPGNADPKFGMEWYGQTAEVVNSTGTL